MNAVNNLGGIEAVILGIDPAKHTSGAGILVPDYGGMFEEDEHPFRGDYYLSEFGKVVTQSERERFLCSSLDTAMEHDLPLIIVAEEWDPPRLRQLRLPGGHTGLLHDPKWTYTTVLGIGEGWGRWSAEIESASEYLHEEEGYPPIPVIRTTPNEWRDDLWGSRRAKESTAAKEQACRYFEQVFGYAASDDISEAGCLTLWGSTSTRVREAVEAWLKAKPKRRKKNRRKAS